MFKKVLFSTMLMLMSLSLLASIGGSQPGAATTYTSMQTLTSVSTSLSYTAVGTTTQTSMELQPLNYEEYPHGYFQNNTFTLAGLSHAARSCYFDDFAFKGTHGQSIHGEFSASYAINFYVMTSDQYQEFNGSGCNEIHPAVLTREQVSSFSFDWVVPQDGLFYIIFLNLHSALDVQITFSATTVLPFTLTSTIYSTIMQSTAVTLTSSVLSTGEVPQASLDMNSFGSNYLFIVAAIVIALLIVIFLLMRRGRSTTKRRPSSRPASGKTVSAEMYCRKCGAKIPRDSTFCLECGSKI